jgi:hypothetical protein
MNSQPAFLGHILGKENVQGEDVEVGVKAALEWATGDVDDKPMGD